MERLPSLNALRAFEQVARTGSLRAAAEQLHVTPSAISHQLKRLEQALGVTLLERSSKQLALTAEGQSYFNELREAFDLLAAATARIRHKHGLNVVTLTTLPVFAIKWLVRRMADFHTRYPAVEVRLSTAYRTQDLTAGGYDLGIRWGAGQWPGLSSTKLMSDFVQPVCSPSFLAQHGSLDEQPHRLVSQLIHMGTTREDWRTWFAMHGLTLPDAAGGLQFSEPTSAIQAAMDGMGIVLGPRALVDDDIQTGRLVPAHSHRIQLHDAYYLVHPTRTELGRTGRLFRDWLIDTCDGYATHLPTPDICMRPGVVQAERPSD